MWRLTTSSLEFWQVSRRCSSSRPFQASPWLTLMATSAGPPRNSCQEGIQVTSVAVHHLTRRASADGRRRSR
jgi:hypothetical protein